MAGNKPRSFFDYTLIFVVLVLCAFGMIMLYSTTAYSNSIKFGDSFYNVKRMLFYLAVGLVVMLIVSKMDYHIFLKWSALIFLVALGMLVAVQIWGHESHGEKRWLYIGPISIQPTELMKIALVCCYPAMINYFLPWMRRRILEGGWKAWMVLFVFLGASVVPVLISNLSSAIIIAGMGVVILFVATKRKWPLAVMIVAGVAALVVFYKSGLLAHVLKDYQMDRINAWLDPTSDPEGNGYQILQSLYAIGSGGLFGKGLGQSIQKLGYLPEAQNDMIFSIICEELGIFGGLLVLGLFAVLVSRMVMIANNAPDLPGMLMVTGVLAHVGIQVIFNLCVSMNLMPNTGVSLPFISSGGSSLVCLMVEVGLVLSVSGRIRLEA